MYDNNYIILYNTKRLTL